MKLVAADHFRQGVAVPCKELLELRHELRVQFTGYIVGRRLGEAHQ